MRRSKRIFALTLALMTTISYAYTDVTIHPSNCKCDIHEDANPRPEMPQVTELYSTNNTIPNAFYKPKYGEIGFDLKEAISQQSKFAGIYTGYFDNNWSDVNKPEGFKTRALEVLGYDSLLATETYSGGYYQNSMIPEVPSKQLIIMSLLKALGKYEYNFSYKSKPNDRIGEYGSPVLKEIPNTVTDIDTINARTEVFVTRTVLPKYLAKAEKDLGILSNSSDMTKPMIACDFLVLVAEFMNYYGEPVLSGQELKQLIQVYGVETPTYLTDRQQKAFLYLKGRGILNIDIDLTSPVKLNDMLDILMCVKDTNSRTTFKNIQLSADVTDLVDKGYFNKDITMASGSKSLQVETKYDYTTADKYDYLVAVTDNSVFTDVNGNTLDILYVSSKPNRVGSILPGSVYNGIKDGLYYHFTVPADYSESSVVINTMSPDDKPNAIHLAVGGGVYTEGTTNGGIYYPVRRSFIDGEFPQLVDYTRANRTTKAKVKRKFNRIVRPVVAFADTNTAKASNNTGITREIKVVNASNVSNLTDLKKKFTVKSVDKVNNSVTFSISNMTEEVFLSKVVYVAGNSSQKSEYSNHKAISSLTGESLISYKDLADKNLVEAEQPIPNDKGILVVNSAKVGKIKINPNTNEILVGSMLYRVPKDTIIYKYQINKETKVNELYLDFRVAYGWANNKVSFSITGSGDSTVVSLDTPKDTEKLIGKLVRPAFGISTYETLDSVNVNGKLKILMTSGYNISNWITYSGVDSKSGLLKEYVFVYYLKDVFKKDAIPGDYAKQTDSIGYEVKSDSYAMRAFQLLSKSNDEIGKVSYQPPYGYVYNIPTKEQFTIEKYLKGDYVLPLYYDDKKDEIVNCNVNLFGKMPYGFVPNKEGKRKSYKGTEQDDKGKLVDYSTVKSAPASISMYFAGGELGYSTLDKINLSAVSNTVTFFNGTMPIKITKDYFTKKITSSFGVKGLEQKLSDDTKLYEIYRYNGTVDYLLSDKENIFTKSVEEEEELFDLIDGEQRNTFSRFAELKLEYIIEAIDRGTSTALFIVTTIMPWLGILFCSVLVGLAFLADVKVFRVLCDKTIDPIEILTLGRFNVHSYHWREALRSLMSYYILMALLLNGNLLRLIAWLLQAVDTIGIILS